MYILYGIKNCDTVKKAKNWLDSHQLNYQFHDYRMDGLEQDLIDYFEAELGWETLLNKRSSSWRQLSNEQKQTISKESAITLMLETPTLIKRPILKTEDSLLIGFSEANYKALL